MSQRKQKIAYFWYSVLYTPSPLLPPAPVRFYDNGPCISIWPKKFKKPRERKRKTKREETTGPLVFAGSRGIKLGGCRYCLGGGGLGRAQGRNGQPRPRGASRQRRTKHPPVHLRIDLNSQLLLLRLQLLLLLHHRGGRRVRKHAGTPRLKQHHREYSGGCRVGKNAGAHRLKQHRREYGGGRCVGCTPGRPV